MPYDLACRDLDAQERFNVQYHKYFFNEKTGTVFCLVEGPDAEACQAVHRESHGLVADDLIEVQPELVEAFFATARYDDVGAAVTSQGEPDGGHRARAPRGRPPRLTGMEPGGVRR